MSEDLVDLAKRTVNADGFRWIKGMVADGGECALRVTSEGLIHTQSYYRALPTDMGLPDFSDPLTCQAVPLMVRAKHGVECYAMPFDLPWVHQPQEVWRVINEIGMVIGNGTTRLAAWVAALEAER